MEGRDESCEAPCELELPAGKTYRLVARRGKLHRTKTVDLEADGGSVTFRFAAIRVKPPPGTQKKSGSGARDLKTPSIFLKKKQ